MLLVSRSPSKIPQTECVFEFFSCKISSCWPLPNVACADASQWSCLNGCAQPLNACVTCHVFAYSPFLSELYSAK